MTRPLTPAEIISATITFSCAVVTRRGGPMCNFHHNVNSYTSGMGTCSLVTEDSVLTPLVRERLGRSSICHAAGCAMRFPPPPPLSPGVGGLLSLQRLAPRPKDRHSEYVRHFLESCQTPHDSSKLPAAGCLQTPLKVTTCRRSNLRLFLGDSSFHDVSHNRGVCQGVRVLSERERSR